MSVPKNDDFFNKLNGHRPNHRDLNVNKTSTYDPHVAALAPQHSGPFSSSLKTQGPKPNNPAPDPVKILTMQLKMEETGAGKAALVKGALHDHKDDPVMSARIRDASLGATQGADRAEIMGAMMKNNPAFLLGADRNSLSLKDANLTGASQEALQALPYNQIDVRGATFPPNLDLTSNAYMGGVGVNLDGVSMPGVNLPANRHILSAKHAQIDQSYANATTAVLSFAGADTGHKATWDFAPRSMKAIEVVPTNTPKITPQGQQLKNNYAGFIDAPKSPFAV